MKNWKMKKMCGDCPFAKSGPGLHLRKTLVRGRWRGILEGLRRGEWFPCHQTTEETGDGSNRVCAGSIEWQSRHGIVADYIQVRERLEKLLALGKEKNEKRNDTRTRIAVS